MPPTDNTPTLEYATPQRASPPSATPEVWNGGYARGIAKIGFILFGVSLLIPEGMGSGIEHANPFRVLATLLLLVVAAAYVLDRLLAVPGRSGDRVIIFWLISLSAIIFVYVQICFLKDLAAVRWGVWRASMLWPSAVVLLLLSGFAILWARYPLVTADAAGRKRPVDQ